MPREFEAKFLSVDVLSMKEKLLSAGAKQLHKPKIYHRVQFKRCGDENGFVRVRKEGEKTTMTTKIFGKDKFPQEYEVTIVEPYEKGIAFLESIGLEKTSVQETMREKWSHPLAHEITFDIVPGLPIYMEVDCTSEANLEDLISLLKLDKKNMQYGSFDRVFTEYYDIPNEVIIKTPSLSFNEVEREIHPKKNDKLFKKISAWNKRLKQHLDNKNEMVHMYKEYDDEIYKPMLVSSPHGSATNQLQSQTAGKTRKRKRNRARTKKKKLRRKK